LEVGRNIKHRINCVIGKEMLNSLVYVTIA
jgi:hypothetical protein